MTPSAWPVVTDSAALESRSKVTPPVGLVPRHHRQPQAVEP